MSISNRVRLYELSRELDLDTKDVIAVCEQLNIVVKSHSSTITESEAELVRTKAPHNHAKTNESRSTDKTDRVDKGDKSDKKNVVAPKSPKSKETEVRTAKQQILTVSKPTIRLSAPPTVNAEPPSPPNKSSQDEPADNNSSSSNQTAVNSLPMPPASSLIQPPARPAAQPSIPSEPLVSNLELINNTALTSTETPSTTTTQPSTAQVVSSQSESKLAMPPLRSPNTPSKDIGAEVSPTNPTEQTVIKESPKESKGSPKEGGKESSKGGQAQFAGNAAKDATKEDRSNPSKPNSQSVTPPIKLVKPIAPERPKPPATAAIAKPPVPPKPPAASPGKSTDEKGGAKVNTHRQPKTEDAARSNQGTEELASKPARPERPKLNRPVEVANNSNKSQNRGPKLVKDSVLIERGITAPSEPPHNLRPPLRAPEKPVIADRTAKKPEPPSSFAPPVLPELLEKPTLPSKSSKRKGKSKEEEEKDLMEMREKNRLNKPKRYLREFDDDDDDGSDLDGDGDLAPISLSLARPTARPKAISMPAKPTMASDIKPTQKPKKSSNNRDRRHQQVEVIPEKPTSVEIEEGMTVAVLAKRLVLSETEVIRTLFMKGIMANINQTLDVGTAKMVATELGYEVHDPEVVELALKTEMIEVDDLDKLERRPPVVTIMGHVDHGKTTLLDAIRKSKVAQGEAGGITQHIGAYHVDVEHNSENQQIVFLDTPGHEAFTAMRARGTKVTDIAVLVVAADDGVQPQTVEAISHARAAKVPIIVAINKVDKIEAQPDRIRQELTEYGLVAEEWGGDTIMVPVSAIKRENLDSLLEMILLVAEVEDLQANPNRTAKGTVIEAHLDKAKGPVATLLVQNGTLRVGDVFVAGSAFGKVRAMVDDRGVRVDKASPSFAVEVLGLGDVPAAGDEFEVYLDEKQARAIADQRTMEQRQTRLIQAMASRRVTLGTLSEKVKEGDLKELNIILKADVQGSLEAILNALGQLPQREVQLRILLSAPGEITENDISLAAASSAVVLGFNTTMAPGARQAADEMGVDFRDYNVIYKLLEDIQDAMEGLLDPEMVEEYLGQAEVRAIFTIGKGAVAGCYVQNGKLIRNCNVRVKRSGEVVHTGVLESLRRVKDDAKEVASGFECGISLGKFSTWKEGDIIEAYRMVTKRRTLATS
ncbi:MAG: translation initiation factor IF-2 [Pseudanabaenaceae cyanobacterium bins.39]|nr:translation initiation factor IF-2 [Pseudanabaenaceae cyanobacterium bins.39]